VPQVNERIVPGVVPVEHSERYGGAIVVTT